MSLRLFGKLRASVAVLLTPSAVLALSGAATCPGPTIAADAEFRKRYPQLVEQLRRDLAGQSDVDACARVELSQQAAGIVVKVALLDGRATAREAPRPEDVRPTLQALLLVPEQAPEPDARPEPELAAAVAATPSAGSLGAAVAEHSSKARGDDASFHERDVRPAVHEREHGFELSLVSGVRVGDGQYGYGAGVLSFIEIRHWLIGFHGRADGYRSLRGSDPETALALGLLLGRRFSLGESALDITAGPAVALRGASFSQTEAVSMASNASPPPVRMPPPEPDVGPVPRLLLAARVGLSPRSVFRTFVGIDAELGPRRGGDVAATSEPSGRMPAYTLGVSLGATVGTR